MQYVMHYVMHYVMRYVMHDVTHYVMHDVTHYAMHYVMHCVIQLLGLISRRLQQRRTRVRLSEQAWPA